MAAKTKYCVAIVLGLFIYGIAQARHITGGEIRYQFLRSSGANNTYQVTLKLYRDCHSTGAQLDASASFAIYSAGSLVTTRSIPMSERSVLDLRDPGRCIDNPPVVCYELGIYTFTIDLPPTPSGYVISYQRCCRIENITNLGGSGQIGATYTASIPGSAVDPSAPQNSSPLFATKDTTVVCEDNFFMYDFGAFDPDGDSLSYSFCDAYAGGNMRDPQPSQPDPPPYASVPYSYSFHAGAPLGPNVKIDTRTGLVSGIAPNAGIYVVTVCANEFRKGKLINIHRKDIQIKITSCTLAEASLAPEYVNCDSYTQKFQNRANSSLIKSYYWEFGDPANTTSTEASPSFTYRDTGVYNVRLITNRFEECSDTANTVVKIYPGFTPDFSFSEGCKDVAIRFTDRTTARYGVVDSWQWDFGVPGIFDDVSGDRNPSYTYTASGAYNVALTVGTSKGCSKTISNELIVRDRPLLILPKDTLMCDVDTISITATGAPGTYTWSPNYNIAPLSGPTVHVSPQQTTDYSVSLTTVPGCTSTETIRVHVVSFVSLDAGADFTMCRTDTVQLQPVSDGLRYEWSPVSTIIDPLVKNALVSPVDEFTTYNVTAHIGKCFARDQITIRTVPYPDVRISNDTAICYGDTAQLYAEGGAYYTWSPFVSISNQRIENPFVSPSSTTVYSVSVTDTLGCPKPTVKSVEIRVIPPVPAFAGNDTVVVLGQPLQLNATGAEFYKWSPGSYLSNTEIANPVALFEGDAGDLAIYSVKVSTPEGCFAHDTISVRIFRTAPDIFMATGFTPNNDGLNDGFRAIPVGIKFFDYLKIFNRWGQLLFSTTDASQAWDGKFNGADQPADTYVWMVSGTDYLGEQIAKKGTFILIR
ncbi:MAG: gliding motility-associated C-terminal domain-containing protein [Chitinophagaceae bacterium]|nr:gliding motility-associated C-terminal domain-containing protein [Chitinophagaceae bacterium]MCW5927616.1 gliding motility-associated C-terminal domain-containing protein [Chitinophagaceae bacterium]